MKRYVVLLLAISALAAPGATAHDFDHPAPSTGAAPEPPKVAQSGGTGAKWEFVKTVPTGNPHTDLDFFTQGSNVFASVGTLAAGANGGGQTIVQLTDGDRLNPRLVGAAPTASCVSNPQAALGLQHDVEATPKGGAILNADVLAADRRDTQLIVDATDAEGRCHDQGVLGLAQAPQGGLEIIDVTNPANPQTIGLTSHIGEAHTVNIDPKRPHIAYAATSDAVETDSSGKRLNEDLTTATGTANAERLDLDGFEMVDLSSCMNFAAGTSIQAKRDRCQPQVFRYRYPSTAISLGHTHTSGGNGVFGCHELEVYPDDRLTCASGNAMIMLDLSGAFDNRGTPSNFGDDRPRGTQLPCRRRGSMGIPPFTTQATVTDCVTSATDPDHLTVPKWLAQGAPSLAGVRWVGSAFHPGRETTQGAAAPRFDSTQDIDFDHEAELSASGRYVLATDERGGGVTPPGASCSPRTDIKQGNGGIHFYETSKLLNRRPGSPQDAWNSYARATGGGKAIYRAPIRTREQDSLCTAHVFQQIPGQNRIFMGWYSQGTQVVDFDERPDDSLAIREAGYFVPENANQWVSHIFRVVPEVDGTFTYYGATGDFNLGNAGRNAIDIYKVNLPPPPLPRGRLAGTGRGFRSSCLARKVKIGRRGIGRLRVGNSKRRVRRRVGAPVRRTRRVYRYCVKRDRRARVMVVFDRRGRARLIASTGRRHRARGVGRGTSVRKLRKRARRAKRFGRGLYALRGRRARSVIYGTRRGKVTYVAVTDRRIRRSRRVLRSYLRLARLTSKGKRRKARRRRR